MARVVSEEQIQHHVASLATTLLKTVGPDFALVGIYTGGVYLAKRLAKFIEVETGTRPPEGTMDITLYRDDLYTGLEKPVLGETHLGFDVTGRGIVLVDDVLFTGRTVRAALNQLLDYGRPEWVRLLVLIDRGHRELPIGADFVGVTIETNKTDRVGVRLKEMGDDVDEVVVIPSTEVST